MSAIGPFTLLPQRTRIMVDPRTGTTYEFYHEGPKSIIESLASQYIFAGLRVDLDHKGQLYRLTVQAGVDYYNPGIEEVPQDDWEIDAEYVQESLWSNYKVQEAAKKYNEGLAEGETLASWRSEMQAELKKAAPMLPSVTGWLVERLELYRLLFMGVAAHEVRRIVLRRVRTVSTRYSKQVVLDSVEKVWTTAALVRDFNIPEVISARLPVNPEFKPANTEWSWKLRGDQSRPIIRLNRVEEHKTWTFAAWSTLLYNLVQ